MSHRWRFPGAGWRHYYPVVTADGWSVDVHVDDLPDDDHGFGVIKPSGSNQTVALLDGSRILAKPKGMEARLYTYTLGAAPRPTPRHSVQKPAVLADDREIDKARTSPLAA